MATVRKKERISTSASAAIDKKVRRFSPGLGEIHSTYSLRLRHCQSRDSTKVQTMLGTYNSHRESL